MDFDISQILELFGKGFICLLTGFSHMWKIMREYSDVVTIAIPVVLAVVVGIFCRYHARRRRGMKIERLASVGLIDHLVESPLSPSAHNGYTLLSTNTSMRLSWKRESILKEETLNTMETAILRMR